MSLYTYIENSVWLILSPLSKVIIIQWATKKRKHQEMHYLCHDRSEKGHDTGGWGGRVSGEKSRLLRMGTAAEVSRQVLWRGRTEVAPNRISGVNRWREWKPCFRGGYVACLAKSGHNLGNRTAGKDQSMGSPNTRLRSLASALQAPSSRAGL